MPLSSADDYDSGACRAAASEPGPRPGTVGGDREEDIGPGSPTVSGAPGLPLLVRLLRDAARTAAGNWGRLTDQHDHDTAVRALAAVLYDLRALSARLAVCSRMHAMADPAPGAFASAASMHATAQFLAQGYLVLSDTGIIVPAEPAQDHSAAGGLCQAASRAAAVSPVITGEDVLCPLAEAVGALANAAGALARSAAEPLPVILSAAGSCVAAAARQLGEHQQARACQPSSTPRPVQQDLRSVGADDAPGPE